ncbi:TlpA disulfide reductase family protein [Sphingopyxis chilensis]
MDGVLQLGPLMLATDRAVAVALLWAFVAVGGMLAHRYDIRAAKTAWLALVAGILAARIGFIAGNFSAFREDPWSMLFLWQGGFSWWLGVAAAALVIVVTLGRTRAGFALLGATAVLAGINGAATVLLAAEPWPLPPGLALASLDGAPIDLDAERGQPMVINLWATWCPPCRREMPMLIDVAAGSTVPVLLANQGESAPQVRAYLKREGLPDGAIRLDPGGMLATATGSSALPTTLFIDGDGRIRKTHSGEISRAALTAAIRDLERNP